MLDIKVPCKNNYNAKYGSTQLIIKMPSVKVRFLLFMQQRSLSLMLYYSSILFYLLFSYR